MLNIDINLLFSIVNILLLFLLVKRFLLKPVHKVLEQRQRAIELQFEQAEHAKAEAQALEQQHREAIMGLSEEKSAVIGEAQKMAAEECEYFIDEAKRQAKEIVQKAEAEAAGYREEILQQTRSEIAAIVVAAARKITGAAGDSSLYDEFLAKAGKSIGADGK